MWQLDPWRVAMDERTREMDIDLLMSRIRQRAIAETRYHPCDATEPCECGAEPGTKHHYMCEQFYRARMAREQELHQEVIASRKSV